MPWFRIWGALGADRSDGRNSSDRNSSERTDVPRLPPIFAPGHILPRGVAGLRVRGKGRGAPGGALASAVASLRENLVGLVDLFGALGGQRADLGGQVPGFVGVVLAHEPLVRI